MRSRKKQRPPDRAPYSSRFLDLLQFQFHLVSRLSERQAEEEVRQVFGLRLRETRIIGMVGSYKVLPVRILTTHGHFEKGHASRLVAALVHKGLIRNDLNPENQRANNLRLTPRGQALYRRIYLFASKSNARWLAVLPKKQHTALSRALAILTKLLSNPASAETSRKSQSGAARRSGQRR